MRGDRIPDSVVMANVRGTYEVPQIYCAAAIYVGAVATPLLLSGELTWSGLQHDPITDAQADRVGRAVNAAHTKHSIPMLYDPRRPHGTTDEERAQGAPPLINRRGLKTVTSNGIQQMTVAATMFAIRSSPELEGVMPSTSAMEQQSFRQLSTIALHEFFTNPIYRPQVLALQGLWGQSKLLLRDSNFLKQAGDYRNGVSTKHGTPQYRQHRLRMEERINRALQVRLGPIAVRRKIEETSGYLIPVDVVKVFATELSSSLKHMHRSSHQG